MAPELAFAGAGGAGSGAGEGEVDAGGGDDLDQASTSAGQVIGEPGRDVQRPAEVADLGVMPIRREVAPRFAVNPPARSA